MQFFDECGQAVHKFFLLPNSCHQAFEQMIDALANSNQDPGIQVQEPSKLAIDELQSLETFDFDSFKNDWANLLDTHDFNLHLRLGDIYKVWLVRKPAKDGVVSSMEILDEQGDVIVLIFSKRKS